MPHADSSQTISYRSSSKHILREPQGHPTRGIKSQDSQDIDYDSGLGQQKSVEVSASSNPGVKAEAETAPDLHQHSIHVPTRTR